MTTPDEREPITIADAIIRYEDETGNDTETDRDAEEFIEWAEYNDLIITFPPVTH